MFKSIHITIIISGIPHIKNGIMCIILLIICKFEHLFGKTKKQFSIKVKDYMKIKCSKMFLIMKQRNDNKIRTNRN